MAKPFKVKNLAPDDSTHKAAERIMRTRLKEFYSHWQDLNETPNADQIHALRISGKRLRYSADMLSDCYADRLALLIELLKEIQDKLGEMQDYETQRRMIETEVQKIELRIKRETNKATRANLRGEIKTLNDLASHFRSKQEKLFTEFTFLWRGLAQKQMRSSLKHNVSHPLNQNH